MEVYTNARSASLRLDEQPLGTVAVAGGIPRWPAVMLAPGRHVVQVTTDHGARDQVERLVTP